MPFLAIECTKMKCVWWALSWKLVKLVTQRMYIAIHATQPHTVWMCDISHFQEKCAFRRVSVKIQLTHWSNLTWHTQNWKEDPRNPRTHFPNSKIRMIVEIHLSETVLGQHSIKIYSANVTLSYTPTVWRQVRMVFLRKPCQVINSRFIPCKNTRKTSWKTHSVPCSCFEIRKFLWEDTLAGIKDLGSKKERYSGPPR